MKALILLFVFFAGPSFGKGCSTNCQVDLEVTRMEKRTVAFNAACGTKVVLAVDKEGLLKHPMIKRGEIFPDRNCLEPMRQMWMACGNPKGKAAVKKLGLQKYHCSLTKADHIEIGKKGGTFSVKVNPEERDFFKTLKPKMEKIVGYKFPFKVENPYYDLKWKELGEVE